MSAASIDPRLIVKTLRRSESVALGCLVEAKGGVVTYETFARRLCWGSTAQHGGWEPWPEHRDRLRVVISRMRAALTRAGLGDHCAVQTVNGEGYRLSADFLARLGVGAPCPTCGRTAEAKRDA